MPDEQPLTRALTADELPDDVGEGMQEATRVDNRSAAAEHAGGSEERSGVASATEYSQQPPSRSRPAPPPLASGE